VALSNRFFAEKGLFFFLESQDEDLGSSGFSPELTANLEPGGYTAILDRIFIPLATLNAACWK
jgi:hypothetical protein